MTPFDKPWSPQDIANAVTAGGTAASPGGTSHATKVLQVVGSQTGTAFQDTYIVTQIYTFTTASAAATGTAVTGLGPYKYGEVCVNVTLSTGTTPTLDVYVDTRNDGTNWTNLLHDQWTTIGRHIWVVGKDNQSSWQAAHGFADGTGDMGAGSARNMGWGDDMRVRIAVAGTSPSFSGAVYANLVR